MAGKQAGSVRIIAGMWRGRRIAVPDLPGLRPTPDRVRVTLFNWLAGHLPGAHVLDLFAGTGVLGFEALSRGAAKVVMVDKAPLAIRQLKETAALLKTEAAEIQEASVPEGLRQPMEPFDIVFLDPPYQSEVLLSCCHYLEHHQFLSNSAYIYLEAAVSISDNELPPTWRIIKRQQAGAVYYHLAQRVSL